MGAMLYTSLCINIFYTWPFVFGTFPLVNVALRQHSFETAPRGRTSLKFNWVPRDDPHWYEWTAEYSSTRENHPFVYIQKKEKEKSKQD